MKKIVISVLVVAIALLGVSYAWFNFNQTGENQKLITGDLYLVLEEATDEITINNVYPMSKEKARARNDNYITFTVSGINTSTTDNIYYEIMLENGEAEEGLERFNPEHLVFDLIEIGNNNEETYLLDAVSFPDINERKIWVDTVLKGTNNEVVKTYKLRMWLSDKILISDSDSNRDYYATGEHAFDKHYASIKVGVYGDMREKSLPSSTTTRESFVENGKSYFMTYLTNDYLLEEEGELLDENDVVTLEITNPENKIYFSYIDSKGNENASQNESLTLTYNYNRNEKVNIKVFTESRNDSNVNTTLHFKVIKNGEIVQEYNKEIFVLGNNYCLNNGFTKLSDCILVTENLSNTVNNAKAFINSKGSPDVNHTAPTYNYVEQVTENVTYTGDIRYKWHIADQYEFDSATGKFTLKKADGTDELSLVDLTNDVIGKYTTGYELNSYTNMPWIIKIASVDIENNIIAGTRLSYKIMGSMDSQVGLYKVMDINGDSYIYRGDVKNNNVYFAGYYWKILRINGDGSIRMIFNGANLNSDGNKTAAHGVVISTTQTSGVNSTYAYNPLPGGPTYVGYMTTESINYWTTTGTRTYTDFSENVAYNFADNFEIYTDEFGNRMFKLKKDTILVKKKLKDLTEEELNANLYTCGEAANNLICPRLIQIVSRSNATRVIAHFVTFSPYYETNQLFSKSDVELNEKDSGAKKILDLWYQNRFMNNTNNGKYAYTYLADAPFCNDRTITRTNNYNSGYLLTEDTYYAPKTRLADTSSPNKFATLMCNKNDAFTVNETTATNGKLTYPIGLITADEVAFAGGKYSERNENYWLRTNGIYWTMSPSTYSSAGASSTIFNILRTGEIWGSYYLSSSSSGGLRPVINLKANTLISMGDGTPSNPYIID